MTLATRREIPPQGPSMSNTRPNYRTTCPRCGHELPQLTETCPGCGKEFIIVKPDLDPRSQWEKAGRTMKLQWVAVVLAFWVSAGVLALVYVLQKQINLILASFVLGFMLLGLWLKTRYQLHQRKEPDGSGRDVRAD